MDSENLRVLMDMMPMVTIYRKERPKKQVYHILLAKTVSAQCTLECPLLKFEVTKAMKFVCLTPVLIADASATNTEALASTTRK